MHDWKALEAAGLPSVFVASAEFVDGANAQARQLGVDPAVVYTAHPVQDRTDSEMIEMADLVLDELVDKLTR